MAGSGKGIAGSGSGFAESGSGFAGSGKGIAGSGYGFKGSGDELVGSGSGLAGFGDLPRQVDEGMKPHGGGRMHAWRIRFESVMVRESHGALPPSYPRGGLLGSRKHSSIT
jgi:hypothetical protein